MTEAEYKRAQEYILGVGQSDMYRLFSTMGEQAYALAWLAYLYVYKGQYPAKAPNRAAWGLTAEYAYLIANKVERLIADLVPGGL